MHTLIIFIFQKGGKILMADITLYSTVRTNATEWYDGSPITASWIRETDFIVQAIDGDKVALGDTKSPPGNGHTTGRVKLDTLTLVSSPDSGDSPASSTETEDVATKAEEESKLTSQQIEERLLQMVDDYAKTPGRLKYTMKLFGIPHQFTQYCDYRTYDMPLEKGETKKEPHEYVGRKFVENIMLEAPVVTIVPGGPTYLPGAKNKRGLSTALIQAANGNVSALTDNLSDSDLNDNDKIRYFDFKQDYFGYMKYVNIMCAMCANLLELGENEVKWAGGGGRTFTTYTWYDYRWNSDAYHSGSKDALGSLASSLSRKTRTLWNSTIELIKAGGAYMANLITGNDTSSAEGAYNSAASDSKSALVQLMTAPDDVFTAENIEDILASTNYVQFYVENTAGVSESADNRTSPSKLAGIFDSGQELLKEAAFIGNTSGIDTKELATQLSGGVEKMNEMLFSGDGTGSGVLNRLLSNVNNVVKGQNIIFPEIYQSSDFRKQYSIAIDLRTPYGTIMGYYLNIVVPLCHLLCLALPRQETANTYGSPFLVRVYYPGVFTCNLGIVESLTIDKGATGDGWTVDGFPTHVKVTLNIIDLYSDLNISKAKDGDVTLFLANSSLIEYMATTCGLNLAVPQIATRISSYTTVIQRAFSLDVAKDSISEQIFGSLDSLIGSLVSLGTY